MPTSILCLPYSNTLKGSILKLTFLLVIFFSEYSAAENKQQQLIKEITKEFLTNKAIKTAKELNASHYKVITQSLDKNIRLIPCKTQIRIKDLSQVKYGNQLLKAQCKNHWDILVTGMIHIYVTALVSKKALTKKHQIQESDIDWQEVEVSQLKNGYLTRPEDAIGKYPNNVIPADTPLSGKELGNTPSP